MTPFTVFTVFTNSGYMNNDYQHKDWYGLDLQDLIDQYHDRFGFRPIAWAAEGVVGHEAGGTKTPGVLRAESIAAGRVIKLIDGKYIPFGEGAPLYCDAQGEPIADTFHCAPETLNPPEPVAEESAEPEKVRPALTWNTPARIDRFPADWSYSSDTATPDHAYSHPLTRVADAGAQVSAEFGSAWLVVR